MERSDQNKLITDDYIALWNSWSGYIHTEQYINQKMYYYYYS